MGNTDLFASADTTVVNSGKSGIGKELIAKAIHEKSRRNQKPLVIVNCSAITPDLFESEFFGHAKGSFTGAIGERYGRFQTANGGTIFLDEIGEIPFNLQGKFLRVFQEEQYERVGEDKTQTVDVRVIAATNKNLEKETEAGNFRLNVF